MNATVYELNESEHIRDRRFEIILEINPVNGPLLTGGHPDCLVETIRVNLKAAADEGRPILSGVLLRGRFLDAWKDGEGHTHTDKEECLVYNGHIFEEITDEEARTEINILALNLAKFLRSPKIRIALGDKFWVRTLITKEATDAA